MAVQKCEMCEENKRCDKDGYCKECNKKLYTMLETVYQISALTSFFIPYIIGLEEIKKHDNRTRTETP